MARMTSRTRQLLVATSLFVLSTALAAQDITKDSFAFDGERGDGQQTVRRDITKDSFAFDGERGDGQ
jgi:hypothetical protein